MPPDVRRDSASVPGLAPVQPSAQTLGQSPNRGRSPFVNLSGTARHSLAAHPAAQPKRTVKSDFRAKPEMDMQKADLATLINAANKVAEEAGSAFGHLTPSQLNWKPSAERWSVGQCFDHLLTTNKGYFPVVENVLAGKKRTFLESMPVLPGLAGKLLIKSLDPSSTRKIKAPKKFQPAHSDISSSVINDFIEQQSRIVEKMKATEHLDLEKIVITSPAAAAITYSLMDAYRIIVVHEQRHLQQAKRVTEESGFPRQ